MQKLVQCLVDIKQWFMDIKRWLMEFYKSWLFEQNLKYNIPSDLWCYDENNGVIIVVHGQYMERLRRAERGNEQFSYTNGRLEVFSLYAMRTGRVLFFSDRPEFKSPTGERGRGGAVGSAAEFRTFGVHFKLERHRLEIPETRKLRLGNGRSLGQRHETDDLLNVVNFAREVEA
jgi:hypothetical protein